MNRWVKVMVSLIAVFAGVVAVASAASSPAVKTKSASSVGDKAATLNGSVNPNGTKTGYVFEWGFNNAYGHTTVVRYVNAGNSAVNVSERIAGLQPGTVYHYRIVAYNKYGGADGADKTFKTTGNPPAYAATGAAINLGVHNATLTAEVNPNHVKTTWYFQYGTTTAYQSRTLSQTTPASGSPMQVSSLLSGLEAGTIFHYRIVANNRGINEYGADATFMTYPTSPKTGKIKASTRPHHAHNKPYTFTTRGHIVRPSSIPAQFACAGKVKVRFFRGKQRVAKKVIPVGPQCKFIVVTVFKHKPGHGSGTAHLHVIVQYLGTGYVARMKARTEHVTAG